MGLHIIITTNVIPKFKLILLLKMNTEESVHVN